MGERERGGGKKEEREVKRERWGKWEEGREMRRSRSGSKERGGEEVRYERREDKERCKGRRKERLTRLEREKWSQE